MTDTPIHKAGMQIYLFDKLQDARRLSVVVKACAHIKTEDLEKCDNKKYHLEICSGDW